MKKVQNLLIFRKKWLYLIYTNDKEKMFYNLLIITMTKNYTMDNELVFVRVDEDGVFAKDKLDTYNEPCFMTRSKRWVEKAVMALKWEFDANTSFDDVCDMVEVYVKKTHRWCAMD